MARSTVLIVAPDRFLEIDARWWRWLRPALLTLAATAVVLGIALTIVTKNYVSENTSNAHELSELRQEVTNLRNVTSAEIEAKLTALRKSQQTVDEVIQYLKARGVNVKPVSVEPRKGMPNPAAGGISPHISKPMPFTDSFVRDTESLLQALQSTPLGVPHDGPLSSRFGMRPNPFTGYGSEMHGGLDFKGDTGDTVRSTADGKVITAERQGGYGNMVEVAHKHGYVTVYGHLSRINVTPGQWVQAGEMIGALGSTGRSTGPHLHYEVQHGGRRLNPETFLNLSAPSR
ncbi:MAG: M23 family metallopeptidase [Burkholderiaceae bacterium]|jgi:murein DD-endopeptidase MepM/ murein hydrolase activator NlpD|nr:M23 family metallopeptidase [Burkholderiaceae bacterium]